MEEIAGSRLADVLVFPCYPFTDRFADKNDV
jgi:hypothetical protein